MKDRKSKLTHYLKYIIIDVLIAAVVSFFTITYVASAYRIDGNSMLTVLSDNERIIISKLGVKDGNIDRGDIVVLRKPDEPKRTIIKRVIGLPGETVEMKKGDVYINGVRLDEPYITSVKDIIYRSMDMAPKEIAKGYYFVMGDNRTVSMDSRFFGPVSKLDIYGKTIFRYWPILRFGKVQ